MGRRPIDMDSVVMDLVLTDSIDEKKKLAKKIADIAYKNGIFLASINGFYMARGKGLVPNNFTVPAMNLRVLTCC